MNDFEHVHPPVPDKPQFQIKVEEEKKKKTNILDYLPPIPLPESVKYGFRCCVFWLFSGVCEPARLRDVLFACLAARQQPLTTAGGFLFNASIEPKEPIE